MNEPFMDIKVADKKPADTDKSEKSIKSGGVAVVLLSALALFISAFAFQGHRGIWQPDEGYYISTAVTMQNRHDLLVPRIGDEIFLEKPPLTYWGIIAGLQVFGHTEFGARAFHALCYAATAVIAGLIGYNLFGSMRNALAAALIYATMVIPFIAGNFVTPDTPLTLWTTLAMLFFWKSVEPNARHVTVWKLLLCLAVGLGFLTKGPAVLIPCGGMFIFLVVTGRTIKYFYTPWAPAGVLIFCATGLSWYVYVALKVPGAASYFFDNQIWGRLVSEKYGRNPGFAGAFIYLPVLIFGSMPWCLIWLGEKGLLKKLLLKSWWKTLPQRPVSAFLLTLFFVPMLILCMASSKLGLYALPVFPVLAIATSRLLAEKMPADILLLNSRQIKQFAMPITMIIVWIALLAGSKLALAYYPTEQDARALWASIHKHIPEGSYEIVTIDNRADGLLFYGAKEVENVTKKENPYPVFVPPDTILYELSEMVADQHPHLFLGTGSKHLAQMRTILVQNNFSYKEIQLPYQRWLVVCNPLIAPDKK